MKTLFYVVLLIIVLAALGAGIYYLAVKADYTSVTDTVNNAVDWVEDKVDYFKSLFD